MLVLDPSLPSASTGLRFPLTDQYTDADMSVAPYEEVETSSADSAAQDSTLLGDLLAVPLKHLFSPSLTADSPLYGQPRLFSDEDYVLPPSLPYEAPFTAAKSKCPRITSSTDLTNPQLLSPSRLSSPLKPSSDVVYCASYSPGKPTGLSVTPAGDPSSSFFAQFALLHPSFYHLVSPDILSSIADLDSKRIYYGPVASLVVTCQRDDLVNDFGLPMPEVEVELKGITDVTALRGVLAWDKDPVVETGGDSAGRQTRSRVLGTRVGSVMDISATASLSKG